MSSSTATKLIAVDPAAASGDVPHADGAGGFTWAPGSGAVASVNGHTGTVSLAASDVGADAAGVAASSMTTHIAASDPHGDRQFADDLIVALTGRIPGLIPSFTPSFAYPQYYIIQNGGALYYATSAFTSGASFSAADWTLITVIGGAGVFNVRKPPYGAQGDANTVYDGSISSGAALLSSASAAFTSADVGKTCIVNGAGPSTTLSSALTVGSPITTLPVAAFGVTMPAGVAAITTSVGTLSSTLSTGAPITSLPMNALAAAVPGVWLTVVSGSHVQTFRATNLTTAAAATSIAVASKTPSFAFPSGSSVYLTQVFGQSGCSSSATSLPLAGSTVPYYPFPSGAVVTTNLTTTISSVSGGVATLAANASTTAPVTGIGGWDGNGATITYGHEDTSAIAAAITDAEVVGGAVYVPRGTYLISSALSVTAGCTIMGDGVSPVFPTMTAYGALTQGPGTAPYLTGSVLLQTAPATDGIDISASGQAVHLQNFGLRFADSIRFANTGHAFNGVPPAFGSVLDNGLMYSSWKGLFVFGHDGNHYAFRPVNTINLHADTCFGYGGGVLQFVQNASNPYGNSIFTNFGGADIVGGSAHVLHLDAVAGSLNILVFDRLSTGQYWVPGAAPPLSTQAQLTYTGTVLKCSFENIDLESIMGGTITFPPLSQIMGNGNNTPAAFVPAFDTNIHQNVSGTTQFVRAAVTFNPTSGAAATFTANCSPNSNMSGSFIAAEASMPANDVVGRMQNINFVVPAGYYLQLAFANVTGTNYGGQPIVGSY